MIEVKLFEVRDRMTFMPVLAARMRVVQVRNGITEHGNTPDDREAFLLRRAGYGPRNDSECVLFTKLDGGKCYYDPYDWTDRTCKAAHAYVQEHWDELESGAVIDVEFISGETPAAKLSEQITSPY